MKKVRITLSIMILFISIQAKSQTDVDAFRYSGESITGTARYTALSGAFGALGGDFTTLSHNPAGIGIFRSSEFTFTPSIYVGSTKSTFLNRTYNDDKTNFNIGNIGLVYTSKINGNENRPGWKSWNFGIGYNRLNNFHSRSYYQGQNNTNSILDHFAENSNGYEISDLDTFYESLAYWDSLTSSDLDNNYYSLIPAGKEIQQNSTEKTGAIGETVFTFGGNYNDKIFLGLTFGLKSLRYMESSTYTETDPDASIPYFKQMIFHQDLSTHGPGFDTKFGLIYKIDEAFRLGLAVSTPTWYAMHDIYKNSMISYLDSGIQKTYASESPDGFYDYDYTSPFRFTASGAYIFGKRGLLSADYEYCDYSDAHFGAPGNPFSEVNSLIGQKYIGTHTFRVGTEWLYQNFSFRAGASYTSPPLDGDYIFYGIDYSKKSLSGGIGFRENNIFMDLGYVYTTGDEYFQQYSLSTSVVPGVKIKNTTNNFVFTFGVKF